MLLWACPEFQAFKENIFKNEKIKNNYYYFSVFHSPSIHILTSHVSSLLKILVSRIVIALKLWMKGDKFTDVHFFSILELCSVICSFSNKIFKIFGLRSWELHLRESRSWLSKSREANLGAELQRGIGAQKTRSEAILLASKIARSASLAKDMLLHYCHPETTRYRGYPLESKTENYAMQLTRTNFRLRNCNWAVIIVIRMLSS